MQNIFARTTHFNKNEMMGECYVLLRIIQREGRKGTERKK